MEPLIKCEHVDLGYENQDAVINVNMEVCPGDYLCIVGENGSGKSTLIKGLLGLLKPSGGKLTVAEELKTTGIGYLPQQTAAQKDFPASVREVISVNRRMTKDATLYTQPMPRAVCTPRSTRSRSLAPIFWLV